MVVQMEEQTSDKSLEDRSGYGKALIWAIPVSMSFSEDWATLQDIDVRSVRCNSKSRHLHSDGINVTRPNAAIPESRHPVSILCQTLVDSTPLTMAIPKNTDTDTCSGAETGTGALSDANPPIFQPQQRSSYQGHTNHQNPRHLHHQPKLELQNFEASFVSKRNLVFTISSNSRLHFLFASQQIFA